MVDFRVGDLPLIDSAPCSHAIPTGPGAARPTGLESVNWHRFKAESRRRDGIHSDVLSNYPQEMTRKSAVIN